MTSSLSSLTCVHGMGEPISGLLSWEIAKEGRQANNAPEHVKFLLDIRLIKKPYLKHNTHAVTSAFEADL